MRNQFPSDLVLVDELTRTMACSTTPLATLLDLALCCVHGEPPTVGAAVLKVDVDKRSWSVLAATLGVDHDIARSIAAGSPNIADSDHGRPGHEVMASCPQQAGPIRGGSNSTIGLYASGRLIGALILFGCAPRRWSAVPSLLAGTLRMCLASAVHRETEQTNTFLLKRSAKAIRRLLEQGAQAVDVDEAAAVLAGVVADAFQTERTGMYLVDAEGIISAAMGVGLPADLNAALAVSLLGKAAADSPAWQSLQLNIGATLVDDSTGVEVRRGGFVQTLGVTSYAAIPLMSKTGLLGMVISGDVAQRTWTAKEHEMAEQFALEGALIVDAARLRASERAQLERITYQAYHDGLTGVPNRSRLMEAVEQALITATRAHTGVAMLLLDLNGFKQVNDTLGHHYGDELLREVAQRLTRAVRDEDLVARLGGDEFAILICGDGGVAKALEVAADVDALLSVPVEIGTVTMNAVASIGIALFPDHAGNANGLLQQADIAMYAAKRSGNGPTVYDPSQSNGSHLPRRRTRDRSEVHAVTSAK